jgi:2-polyprenyl-6-methoxyphenol hydroxylase-like FAD-dependent oxidoreductase
MTPPPDVLVVGAGPTGLALALQAHEHGARVRVVERRPGTFRPSRAMFVHPRTLELLRPLGVTDALLAHADASPRACLHLGRTEIAVGFGDLAMRGTAFPTPVVLRQLDVETVLADTLSARGVAVQRGTELVGLDPDDAPRATLRTPAGLETSVWRAVVGCDGIDSTARTAAGIGWAGGTYRPEAVLADVDLSGALAGGVTHVVAGRRGLLFLFSPGEGAPWRLLGTRVAGRDGGPGAPVPDGELQAMIDAAGIDARLTGVAWSTRVSLQHRVADRYRRGGVFLAGDAAHASSPAGGQGMNTGIHDALNLGWKLALAGASSAPGRLLDSYEQERRPAAQQVLALTHALFWAEASTGRVPSFLRGTVAPRVAPLLPWLLERRRLATAGVRLLAQFSVGYRGSRLAAEGTPPRQGQPRAGDRLPDAAVTCDGRATRLHDLLARPGIHLLLDRDAAEPRPGTAGPLVHVHRLTSSAGEGVVAVRPDGHVGYRSAGPDPGGRAAWLRLVGARAGTSSPAGRVPMAVAAPPSPPVP